MISWTMIVVREGRKGGMFEVWIWNHVIMESCMDGLGNDFMLVLFLCGQFSVCDGVMKCTNVWLFGPLHLVGVPGRDVHWGLEVM